MKKLLTETEVMDLIPKSATPIIYIDYVDEIESGKKDYRNEKMLPSTKTFSKVIFREIQ